MKATVTLVSPRTTELSVGAPGGPSGVTALVLPEATEDPAPLVATTLNVYGSPFVSPFTKQPVDPFDVLHVAPPGDAVAV